VPLATMDCQEKTAKMVTLEALAKMVRTDILVDRELRVLLEPQAIMEPLAKMVTLEPQELRVLLDHLV